MTEHDKHNRTGASPLRRLLKAFGIGKERGRECARSEQRSRDHRRSEAGNVFFTLFGAVAIVGVLGAGIMSTMRGPLTTMVEVNRIEEAKSVIRLNSRLVLQNATRGDSADANPPTTPPASAYCDDDDFTEAPEPVTCSNGVEGSTNNQCIPGNVGATLTDPWGTPYGYCAWNHGPDNDACGNIMAGANNTTNVAIAIISAGPDRVFNTTCAQLYTGDGVGDDIVNRVEYNEAAGVAGGGTGGGLWTDIDPTTAGIGRDLRVEGTGTSTFDGGAQFGSNVSLGTGALVDTPGILTDEIAAKTGGTLTLSANTTVDGSLTVSSGNPTTLNGATTITDTLTVSGNNATTLGGTLDVTGDTTVAVLNATGAVDFDSNLNVDGNITSDGDGIVNIDDALDVTGATTLQSTLTINSDGNDNTTDAIVVNDSDSSEIMALDDAGNLDIAGTLTADGGIADPESTAGNVLVSDGAVFNSVPMSGDVAIASNGETTIQNNVITSAMIIDGEVNVDDLANNAVTTVKIADLAVTNEKIANGAITQSKINAGAAGTDECLKFNGTDLEWGNCYTSGGGGDGVGNDGFIDLADTPADYAALAADADKLVIVNPTGDGLIFVDPATIATGEPDRIYDASDPTDTYIDVDIDDTGDIDSIVFVNDGTESMRILANGNVGIGTNAPASDLHIYNASSVAAIGVEGNAAGIAGLGLYTSGDGATLMGSGTGSRGWLLEAKGASWSPANEREDLFLTYWDGSDWNEWMFVSHDTGYIGLGGNIDPTVTLDVTGDIQYTGTITDISDIRLKTDITKLSAQDMIARLAAVDTYTFRMKDDEKGRIEYGVMAQELEKIFPELVNTASDEMGTKSVNYIGLIAPIIEATKTLKTENDELKAELDAVKQQQAVVLATLETMQNDMNGLKAHTGYGIEKGTALAMLLLLLSLGGITGTLIIQRKKPAIPVKDRT